MENDNEKDILLEVLNAIHNTFTFKADDAKNPIVEELMKEHFLKSIIVDIAKSTGPQGIDFSMLNSAFSYFFTKTIDAVLILKKENNLIIGINVLYDFADIKYKSCGVSEYFDIYGKDPDGYYSMGENFFLSFQKLCVKYKKQIEYSPAFVYQMISGALIAMIPLAILCANDIIEKMPQKL